MLITKYDQFVQRTDQTKDRPLKERRDIAIYGLASEIGSVAAAIKKRLLSEGGKKNWNAPSDEIGEELGDVMWYCFALARFANPDIYVNIFIHDINNLQQEFCAPGARADSLQRLIGPETRADFLKAAEAFLKQKSSMSIEGYQRLAFLTARTENKTLVEVCIAVLYQLSAELFRHMLPDIERELNQSIKDRPINDVLGEIAWHIAALASSYGIDLGDVAQKNIEKISFRQDRNHPTKLHDSDYEVTEQLPRKFEVAFVTTGKGKSQMYLDGRRLGDQLTDNAHDDDGYRFHDVMHLANAAKLGWSPVLRGLMGRKRKSRQNIDEVEDGARAKIVEELVIKAIHTEGQRIAEPLDGSTPLFILRENISFGFLKFIRRLTAGLEVKENRYWEWEDAIIEGFQIFHQLRLEEQGTVLVDLDRRSIEFTSQVHIPLTGRVAGLGTAIEPSEPSELGHSSPGKSNDKGTLSLLAKKRAILLSLGFPSPTSSDLNFLSLEERADGEVSVKATGEVRAAMWERKVVAFRISITETAGSWHCTALALSDE